MNGFSQLSQTTTVARVQVTASDAPDHWGLLGGTYLGLGVVALLGAPLVDYASWWLHGLWCCAGLAAALPTLAGIFRSGFGTILTDFRLMFLASFSVYFLFGALLLSVGPEGDVDVVLSYYPIGAGEALRADAINSLGFGIAMLTFARSRGRWIERHAGNVAKLAARVPAYLVIALFLGVGLAASAYRLPFALGTAQGTLPGLIGAAGDFLLVGIFLASSHEGTGAAGMRVIAVASSLTLAVVGLLLFSKTSTLLPLAALTAGLALRFGSRRILPLGLTLLVGSFLTIGDLVNYGRNALLHQDATTLEQRWEYLLAGWSGTRDLAPEDRYSAWSRLCYVPAQVAALDLQDQGQGGDGANLMLWVLVPRALFPEKPEITKTGREFHEKISGQDTSSTGQGLFASGYYHGGWLGFILASAACGWILAQMSAIARSVQSHRALLMLPFPLVGMYTAFRVDGDIVSDYLGTYVFLLYPILAVAILQALSSAQRSS